MRKAKLLSSILCLMIFVGCNHPNENMPVPTGTVGGTKVHNEIEESIISKIGENEIKTLKEQLITLDELIKN